MWRAGWGKGRWRGWMGRRKHNKLPPAPGRQLLGGGGGGLAGFCQGKGVTFAR